MSLYIVEDGGWVLEYDAERDNFFMRRKEIDLKRSDVSEAYQNVFTYVELTDTRRTLNGVAVRNALETLSTMLENKTIANLLPFIVRSIINDFVRDHYNHIKKLREKVVKYDG